MSFTDETCDFCGAYIDGIGCDSKSIECIDGEQKYWDGQCIQGMDAMWSKHPIEDVEKASAHYQALYDADPIDWETPQEPTPESMQRRIKQLFYMDRTGQLARYAQYRRDTAT